MNSKWACKIIRIDYDNMEDPGGEAIVKELVHFIASDDKPIGLLVRKWFEKLEPQKMYMGLDNTSYPKFKVEEYLLHDSVPD